MGRSARAAVARLQETHPGARFRPHGEPPLEGYCLVTQEDTNTRITIWLDRGRTLEGHALCLSQGETASTVSLSEVSAPPLAPTEPQGAPQVGESVHLQSYEHPSFSFTAGAGTLAEFAPPGRSPLAMVDVPSSLPAMQAELQVERQSHEQFAILTMSDEAPTAESGEATGTESGDQSGYEAADQSGYEAGDQSGAGSGDQSGNEAGDQSGAGSGDQSGYEAGDQSGAGSGDQSGAGSGDQSGAGSGDQSGYEAGDQSGYEAGDQSGYEAADQSGAGSGDQSGAEAGHQSVAEAGDQSGYETADESGAEVGDESGAEAGDQSGAGSGDQSGYESGDQSGAESGDQSGAGSGDQSGAETGDQSGGEANDEDTVEGFRLYHEPAIEVQARPNNQSVRFTTKHPQAGRASGTAALDLDRGGIQLHLRGLPSPATLGKDKATGRLYNAYHAWLVGGAKRTRHPLGYCERAWGENFRLSVPSGLPLAEYDTIQVTVADRGAPPNPAGQAVLASTYG